VNFDDKTPKMTFRGPCIVIYSYSRSQQDALFLNFILVKNSTCFGQTYCLSSGVLILYSHQLVFCHTSYVECLLARLRSQRSDLRSISTALADSKHE